MYMQTNTMPNIELAALMMTTVEMDAQRIIVQ
jgi:hypothetical protein